MISLALWECDGPEKSPNNQILKSQRCLFGINSLCTVTGFCANTHDMDMIYDIMMGRQLSHALSLSRSLYLFHLAEAMSGSSSSIEAHSVGFKHFFLQILLERHQGAQWSITSLFGSQGGR